MDASLSNLGNVPVPVQNHQVQKNSQTRVPAAGKKKSQKGSLGGFDGVVRNGAVQSVDNKIQKSNSALKRDLNPIADDQLQSALSSIKDAIHREEPTITSLPKTNARVLQLLT